MALAAASELLTADYLDTTPDDGRRYEVIDGALIVNPAPTPVHQRAVLHLSRLLHDCALPDHEVYVAPIDLYLDEHTVVEPDLVVLPVSSVGVKRLSLPVDIVVEVLSPSSRKLDRAVKFERYAEAGIPCYWIVDPEAHTIERFQLVGSSYKPSLTDFDAGLARLDSLDVLVGWR